MKSLKKLLNALSVLLLGTSTSLNAQTPPQKPLPAPQTTQQPPVQKTEKDSKPIKYNTPILTPEQVIEGLLRLAESLHEKTDLTPERIKNTIGISMKSKGDGTNVHHTFANAFPDTEWFYSMRLYPDAYMNSTKLYFSFLSLNPHQNRYPPMTPICNIDMEAVHRILLEVGYKHVSSVRSNPVSLGRQYRRDGIYIDMSYVGESKDDPYHKCLSALKIM